MDVCEWLERVKKLDQLIDTKISERERVMMQSALLNPDMDGMPKAKGGVSDPVGNAAVKLAELAIEIDRLVDQYVDEKMEVVRTLEQLPPDEYGVLHRYYIQYMTWEEVAEDMNFCTVQVWRIKNRGFERLQVILAERGMKHER